MQKNIVSYFDGMSCCQLGLVKAGKHYDNYFASEIEQSSIDVTQYNFPDTLQIGDVTKINLNNFPKIWLMTAGSPCQDLSISNTNGQGLDGIRSGLFYEFLKGLKTLKPKYFLLENVRPRKQEWEDQITNELLLIYPDTKLHKINSNLFSAQNRLRYYWTNIPIDSLPEQKNPLVFNDIAEEMYEYKYLRGNSRSTIRRTKRLTTKSKNGNYVQWDSNGKKNNSQWDRAYFPTEKICTLTKIGSNKINICVDYDNDIYRKIEPIEAERLQTVPDNYTNVDGVSENKRFEMLGNGWSISVISFIFKNLQ